jgi:hypothetical protein
MLKGNCIINKISQSTQTEELKTNEFSTQSEDLNVNEIFKNTDESFCELCNPFKQRDFKFAADVHKKVDSYLNKIQKNNINIMSKLINKIEKLMDTFRGTHGTMKGVKNAIDHYQKMKNSDKDYFLLICYLEIFYELDFSSCHDYPIEEHDNNFRIALSYAYDFLDKNGKKVMKELYCTKSD